MKKLKQVLNKIAIGTVLAGTAWFIGGQIYDMIEVILFFFKVDSVWISITCRLSLAAIFILAYPWQLGMQKLTWIPLNPKTIQVNTLYRHRVSKQKFLWDQDDYDRCTHWNLREWQMLKEKIE